MILRALSRNSRVFHESVPECELFSVRYCYGDSWSQKYCMSDWNGLNVCHLVWGV